MCIRDRPIVAPNDVDRYFVTPKESGELCLMSCIFGENGDTFFPQENESFKLTPLKDVALRFLDLKKLKPIICETEGEARNYFTNKADINSWACFFPASDTTGEKPFEEFFTATETIDLERFNGFGVIKNIQEFDDQKLSKFLNRIQEMRDELHWTKSEIVELFLELLPEFEQK